MIWTGTCGFGRGQVEVMRNLAAVEIQETFYHPVPVARAAKWRGLAPPEFRFAVKASQFITHEVSSPTYRRSGRVIPPKDRAAYGNFQDSLPVREGWEATRAVAEALGAHMIVFQTPSTFRPTDANRTALFRFFESIRTDATKGIELRGGWATHLVTRICEEIGLVHVVDPFANEPATYGLAYFRLHGSPPGPSMYRYTYTDANLVRLKAICDEYDDSYVMFNNFSMQSDALRFQRNLLESRERTGPAHE